MLDVVLVLIFLDTLQAVLTDPGSSYSSISPGQSGLMRFIMGFYLCALTHRGQRWPQAALIGLLSLSGVLGLLNAVFGFPLETATETPLKYAGLFESLIALLCAGMLLLNTKIKVYLQSVREQRLR